MLFAQDYVRVLKSRWKEALLVFLLIFLSCAVITKMTTPLYSSSMSFEIKPARELFTVASGVDTNVSASLTGDGVAYMQTQFEVLVSEQNLAAVANKLDLSKEWGVDDMTAARMLMGMIHVMPRKGTNIVDVVVKNGEPRLAQQICQAVADCYKEVREEKENALINEAINKRYELLRSRQDVLEGKADVVRQYIRSGKYIQGTWSAGGNSTPVSAGSEEQSMGQLNSNRMALESEISQMTVHIGKLQNLKDEELLSYVTRTGLLTAESYCSAKVRQLNDQYTKEEDERTQKLLSGYGEKHPAIQRLDEQHRNTREQLYQELVGMRDAMMDQLDVKKSELADVQRRYEAAKGRLRDKTIEDQKVQNAIQEYVAEKQRYDKLENDYIGDQMRLMAPRPSVEIYSRPLVASVPSSPNYRLNLIVGAVIGIVAGIVTAFLFNYFDTSIKSLEDAERKLGLPVLGVIPQDVGLLSVQQGESPDAEAYRILRTNIELKKALFNATTFTVASANAGEGKTTTLSNLGYVFAQAGYSTLMVDADLRRPRLARYNEVQSEAGLSNFLSRDMELKDVVVKTSSPNLYLLPSGPTPSDPSGLLGSYRMDRLIAEASQRFDIVLFDAPPILGVSDASLLVSKCDATLMVVQPRKMPVKALLRSKMLIQNAGGQIMGLVMNNVDISGDTQYQYYTTYYSYYRNDTSRKEPDSGRKEEKHASPVPVVSREPENVDGEKTDNGDDLY